MGVLGGYFSEFYSAIRRASGFTRFTLIYRSLLSISLKVP
jgi:hypothetical protein